MKCHTFADLHNDCLIEVLDWLSPIDLFRMLRVNKQLNRLAAVKLKVKIKAITIFPSKFSFCTHHLGVISSDQVLVLKSICFNNRFIDKSSKYVLFLNVLNVLTKCSGVKSIDLKDSQLPGNLIIEMFRRCPELECLKFDSSNNEISEFESILSEIGNKVVHIVKDLNWNRMSEARLLSTVASKFANIKRIYLYMMGYLTSDLVSAFKMPKTCWLSVKSGDFTGDVYEDNLDELHVWNFDWSTFGSRLERLTSFKFRGFQLENDLVYGGINFAGLKKLDVRYSRHSAESVNCLASSQYPKLEEFSFVSGCLEEKDFDRVFQQMTSVKKLTIYSNGYELIKKKAMPRSAINHLKNLETIVLVIHRLLIQIQSDWQLKGFLNQFDRYVYEISSLKKLVVETYIQPNDKLYKQIVDEVRQIKMKQNRVEVVLVRKN